MPADGLLVFLLIDDEPQIRRVLENALLASGPAIAGDNPGSLPPSSPMGHDGPAPAVKVLHAATGSAGIDLAAAEQPALIVLDLGLPDTNGLDVCREIRRWCAAPIIVLSARHADTEKAALLDAGADDYLTKPFSTLELIARVRAQLRRARRQQNPEKLADSTSLAFGDITVDPQLRRVERAGVPIHLTPTEWGLLRALVTAPRRTLTHRQLFTAVWGNSEGDAQQYLRVYVGHLRRKLEADPLRPRYLHTEPGVGYRFEPDGGGGG